MDQQFTPPSARAVPVSLAVLMTTFNRRQSTLDCLERLYAQEQTVPRTLRVFLVDDMSRDGTAEAVQQQFPDVSITHGNGSLFWNRGMHRAFAEAMRKGFDYYLWLNDDTLLAPHALDQLLTTSQSLLASGVTSIVTGSTCEARSGRRSYGGSRVVGRWFRSLQPVQPDAATPQPCDTMNGNVTLIPRSIADRIGNLDPIFHHAFGDLDYGFRAREAGFAIYLAPGFLGTCSDNPSRNTWRDRKASFKTRWRHLTSPKGSPFREWAVYCRRHLGLLWPLYAISPYVKTLVGGLLPGR